LLYFIANDFSRERFFPHFFAFPSFAEVSFDVLSAFVRSCSVAAKAVLAASLDLRLHVRLPESDSKKDRRDPLLNSS